MARTARGNDYALGDTPAEYERLRAQARMWEPELRKVLATVGLSPGARCLDAGCGPGEGMRVLAQHVGAGGDVVGADIDARAGAFAVATLHAEGHPQCRFVEHDFTSEQSVPGGPYDLVLARWLLFHLPHASVLRRLWESVAPGGVLLVQDFDQRTAATASTRLASLEAVAQLVVDSFCSVGADPFVGTRLPVLFAEADAGRPDGTDVAGRLLSLAVGRVVVEQIARSLLPVAVAHGVTSQDDAERALAELGADAARFPDVPLLSPVLVSAWRRKPA